MDKPRVLIIEDEKDLRQLLRYHLEKENYDVLAAESGEEGIELARSREPDTVLLDLLLPKIDGLEVCRLLKSFKETRHIPVMMLTAKSSEVDQVVGLEMGAADYMTKPFSIKVLLARLKNLIKKEHSPVCQETQICRGDFSIDTERVVFKIKDRPAELTKTEFRIMQCLMENPGIVLSREKIARAVWGEGALVSSTAINMHVTSLRKKLGQRRRLIETVRSLGYRLKENSR